MSAPTERWRHAIWCVVEHPGMGCSDQCPACGGPLEALVAELDALREQQGRLRAALSEGRMALASAIGLMEAHWEVCADPFPDASLRRTLDRMSAAESGSSGADR